MTIDSQIQIIQETARERGFFVSSEQAEWLLDSISFAEMSKDEIFEVIERKLW